jgi:hypothetical protein
VPFTLRNIKEDLEDVGSRFDGAPDLEFRLATEALELEKSGLGYQRVPPGYRFLFDGRVGVKSSVTLHLLRPSAPSVLSRAHFSFGARSADRSWELPRLLNSMQDRQAARKREELAGAVDRTPPLGRLGWKTCSRESMCQEVIRSLRATDDFAGFLPWRSAIRR